MLLCVWWPKKRSLLYAPTSHFKITFTKICFAQRITACVDVTCIDGSDDDVIFRSYVLHWVKIRSCSPRMLYEATFGHTPMDRPPCWRWDHQSAICIHDWFAVRTGLSLSSSLLNNNNNVSFCSLLLAIHLAFNVKPFTTLRLLQQSFQANTTNALRMLRKLFAFLFSLLVN